MNNTAYAKAFTEVLEILKYIPENEYNKIPKDRIELFKEHMDSNYNFKIDPNIELIKQEISEETKTILVTLFRDYFATEEQRIKLKEYYKMKDYISELEKKSNYKDKDLFKNSKTKEQTKIEIIKPVPVTTESFFEKFKRFIFKLLGKYKNQ